VKNSGGSSGGRTQVAEKRRFSGGLSRSEESEMSAVDLVVPCYNYARFLSRCISSILSQADVDVRVLIIDDTSSDDTPEVGLRLAAMDSRVKFRRHEQNRGHIATYNEGLLEWATAKYSMLISADDLLAPGPWRGLPVSWIAMKTWA
jgi:cellulose synthase/poly-beta-1,6-N-acetylglucosamine synthase-like glycosyltransferase